MRQTKSPARTAARPEEKPLRPDTGWIRATCVALSITAIGIATLTPSGGSGGGAPASCFFICGARGLADTISNVLLFLPFGIALTFTRFGARHALIAGIAVAVGVEAAQLTLVAGRDANLADVVSNAIGAVLGAKLGLSSWSWVAPSSKGTRGRLIFAASSVIGIVALTGVLLKPRLPPGPYTALITHWEPGRERYTGGIIRAELGGDDLPLDGIIPRQSRALFESGATLRLHLRLGRQTGSTETVFGLRSRFRDAVHLHVDREDLLLGYRSVSSYYWLDEPAIRLRHALAGSEAGDTVVIDVARSPLGFCVTAGAARTCSDFSAASGWRLFQQLEGHTTWLPTALDLIWFVALGFPLGLWLRRDRYSLLVISAFVLGVVALSFILALALPGPTRWVALAVGVLSGGAFARWLRRGLPGGSLETDGADDRSEVEVLT